MADAVRDRVDEDLERQALKSSFSTEHSTGHPTSSGGGSVGGSGGGSDSTESDSKKTFAKGIFCFVGLQTSYLTWGYMQELIMTTQFVPTPLSPKGLFPSATFCVFSNRFLAVILALALCRWKHGVFGVGKAGWLSFAPCSASNTLSSWAQYGE